MCGGERGSGAAMFVHGARDMSVLRRDIARNTVIFHMRQVTEGAIPPLPYGKLGAGDGTWTTSRSEVAATSKGF